MARFIYEVKIYSMRIVRQARNEDDARKLAIDLCMHYHRPVFINRFYRDSCGDGKTYDTSYDAWTEYTYLHKVVFHKIRY